MGWRGEAGGACFSALHTALVPPHLVTQATLTRPPSVSTAGITVDAVVEAAKRSMAK